MQRIKNIYISVSAGIFVWLTSPLFTPAVQASEINRLTTGANNVVDFMQGPIARSVVILALIVCGGTWFLNRQEQSGQMMGKIAIGAGIIFLADPVFSILGLGTPTTANDLTGGIIQGACV